MPRCQLADFLVVEEVGGVVLQINARKALRVIDAGGGGGMGFFLRNRFNEARSHLES